MREFDDPIQRYHDHLDKCPQCENNPFNQCGIGAALLNIAGTFAMNEMLKGVPQSRPFQHCPSPERSSSEIEHYWPDEDPDLVGSGD